MGTRMVPTFAALFHVSDTRYLAPSRSFDASAHSASTVK